MQAGHLKIDKALTIDDGARDIIPCQDQAFVWVAEDGDAGIKAVAELTPTLGKDKTEDYAVGFHSHSRSNTLLEMVERANRHLGSVQIQSVVAIYCGDDIAWIRVKAEEGARVRIIFQNPHTRAKDLLTTVSHPFFDDLRQAVLNQF